MEAGNEGGMTVVDLNLGGSFGLILDSGETGEDVTNSGAVDDAKGKVNSIKELFSHFPLCSSRAMKSGCSSLMATSVIPSGASPILTSVILSGTLK